MQIAVNPSDALPIYRQIVRQIVDAIAGGRLKTGEKVPSHRELSERIVVAPLTVKKAYDELEVLGFLETQRGRGTFVCSALPEIDREEQLERIRQDGRTLLSQARLAGLPFSELVKLLRSVERELTGGASEEIEYDSRS